MPLPHAWQAAGILDDRSGRISNVLSGSDPSLEAISASIS